MYNLKLLKQNSKRFQQNIPTYVKGNILVNAQKFVSSISKSDIKYMYADLEG